MPPRPRWLCGSRRTKPDPGQPIPAGRRRESRHCRRPPTRRRATLRLQRRAPLYHTISWAISRANFMAIDPSAVVAPTARVHPEAVIGAQTVVGEYCVIEQDTAIGPFCVLEPYVYVKRWTTLGERNEISAGTVLGTDPLDKNFKGDRSYLRIGKGNKIREHYTIS